MPHHELKCLWVKENDLEATGNRLGECGWELFQARYAEGVTLQDASGEEHLVEHAYYTIWKRLAPRYSENPTNGHGAFQQTAP